MSDKKEIRLRNMNALLKMTNEELKALADKHGVNWGAYVSDDDHLSAWNLAATLSEFSTIEPGNHVPEWEQLC